MYIGNDCINYIMTFLSHCYKCDKMLTKDSYNCKDKDVTHKLCKYCTAEYLKSINKYVKKRIYIVMILKNDCIFDSVHIYDNYYFMNEECEEKILTGMQLLYNLHSYRYGENDTLSFRIKTKE